MSLRIKICGLRTPDTLTAALDAGADLVGLVFFPPSPRHVSVEEGAGLARIARGRAEVVALTVDADDALLGLIVDKVRPDLLQLHGRESPERVREVRRRFGLPVIKAVTVATAGDAAAALDYAGAADLILFDARPPQGADRPGGHGRVFDWHLLAGIGESVTYMLSGGLTPANVLEALQATGAGAVDVSSGVERAPGVKDPERIRAFIATARGAGPPAAAERPRDRNENESTMPTTTPPTEPAGPTTPNSYRTGPDEQGFFGIFGGRFVAETLMPLILELEAAYEAAKADPAFARTLGHLNTHYSGRPSPLYFAEGVTAELGGAKVYFKRDELNHTGSHKINNCLGQILLAKRMGKTRIIAETGAGQHGVAVATVCAKFKLPCEIYMGATDVERQAPNVGRMKLLGARVNPVTAGAGTLKDAMNEALRDWVTNVRDTYYIIGTAAGPHPYPALVRDFQSVIGREVREQMLAAEGRLPDTLVACIGGGSNAIGLFHPFLDDASVRMFGVEAGGHGLDVPDGHCASLTGGRPGVLHGNRTYLLQTADGQILEGHSISAGLDYPGIGPEHSWLHDTGRVEYVVATDKEALAALQLCTRLEGIIPALEPSHALAHVMRIAPELPKDHLIVMNLCGRGDKDLHTVAKALGMQM